VAKEGGYSSNVESIHGAIHKLAKISDENKNRQKYMNLMHFAIA
jgi:hypothetical protein